MSETEPYLRSREELAADLRSQIGFLDRSAAEFDAGHEDEAARLAVTIRVLLSDGGRGSRSLLGQLGIRDGLAFVDTSLSHRDLRPDHPGFNAGLASMELLPGRGGRYVPLLEKVPADRRRPGVPFSMWWNKKIYRRLSRADLVAGLANQDGGAHVDAELKDAYADLTRRNGLGWEYSDSNGISAPFEGNAARASMRQMAWELGETLRAQVGPDGALTGATRVVGRNDPCPCGAGKKFKRCCGA